ncbi:DUF6086 family protein [Dactylosporangium sp. AC04546]|uniref:DUF6086 family protein n=1 Tax=Dactylosporangium sp. AC04546 TaxID=2862460 RepID=UPI001EDCA1F7|nr:DUF6086 family protein [Dactylosporangium sp. AC04546]WVK84272.1 DUF6086 family protein [Dactylosporangium sp. AC04546]
MGTTAYVDGIAFWEPGEAVADMFCVQVRVLERWIRRSSGIVGPESDEIVVDPLKLREFLVFQLNAWARTSSPSLKAMLQGTVQVLAALDEHLNGPLRELGAVPEIQRGRLAAVSPSTLRPAPWGPPTAADLPQSVRFELATIVQDLVRGWYKTLEERLGSAGWPADRLREVVESYAIPLLMPPQRIPPDLISTVEDGRRTSLMSLWDTVYGVSRLRLQVVHDEQGHRVTWLGFGDPPG